MKHYIRKLANFVVSMRWPVILGSLVLLFSLGSSLSSLKNVWSYEMWFQEDDERIATYQNFRKRFGEGMYMLVGIEAAPGKTVFDPNALKYIDLLTRHFEASKHVNGTISLTNYHRIGNEDGHVAYKRLFHEGDDLAAYSPHQLQVISEQMRSEERTHKYLLTKDAKRTIIQAKMSYRNGEVDHYFTVVRELRKFLAENNIEQQDFKVRLSGGPFIYENFDHYSRRDFGIAVPLMFLLAIVFLAAFFRSLAGFFLPISVVIATILSTFGAMAATGVGIDTVNVNLPLLILIMGIAGAIHVMVDFYRYRREGYTPKDASRKTIEELFIPCLVTSLTTALGFLSLYSSAMPPIQGFGLWGAFAVSLAYLYSLFTLPALLSFVQKVPHRKGQQQSLGFLRGFLDKLVGFLEVRGKHVALGCGAMFLAAAAFSTQITVDHHYLKAFKDDTRVRQDMSFFDESFGGVPNFEVVLDSGREKGIFDRTFIEKASRFEKYVAAIPDVGKTTSPLPVLNAISGLREQNESASSRELGLAEDFRRLIREKASGDTYSFVSPDERFARIQITMPILPTSRTTEMLNEIRKVAAAEYPELKVDITGGFELSNHLNQYIHDGMVTSFALTLAWILLCMVLVLRSMKFSLIAVIPAVTSVVVAGGVMGAFGIYLDMTNMIVAAVTLGIADDDAIHLITRYRAAKQSGVSKTDAVRTALHEAGPGVIYTSLILIAGFSILMTSSFVPNIYYGLLSVIVIAFALISSLVLVPALLLHYDDAFVGRKARKQSEKDILPSLEPV